MPTVLVTGSNRGLGLELSRQYAEDGWRVIACCRKPRGARELAALARRHGGVSVHGLDVTDEEGIRELARELRGEKIDILFNNAGTSAPRRQEFGPIDTAGWVEAFRVNAIGPYIMAAAFAGHVARSDRKVIAAMSSIMGSVEENGSGGYYAYRSSKAALNMVMKGLAADLRPRGIITVCLHPGWVRTRMGGPGATQTPEESAAGLRRQLASLTQADSGRFITYLGEPLPW
ncbi:MAG: SDR family oxidoreductase [Thermodesulfovibrionales bacterium]